MKKLLHLVGCLHRYTNDARSHKHQVRIGKYFRATVGIDSGIHTNYEHAV